KDLGDFPAGPALGKLGNGFVARLRKLSSPALQQQADLAAPAYEIAAQERTEAIGQHSQPATQQEITILRRGVAGMDELIAEVRIAVKLKRGRFGVEKPVGTDFNPKSLFAQRPGSAAGPRVALEYRDDGIRQPRLQSIGDR